MINLSIKNFWYLFLEVVMKKNIFLILLVFVACKKEVVIEKQVSSNDQFVKNQENSSENKISTKERNIIFNQSRKTELEYDESNEYVTNMDKFISDSDRRIIEVKVENQPLTNGNLKCFNVSDSTNKIIMVDQSFLNEGTTVRAEILIQPNGFNEIKAECNISDDSSENIANVSFELRNDLIIEEQKTIDELNLKGDNMPNKVDHLVILENGVLKLLDRNISVNAKNILAIKGAKIETFGSDTDAMDNLDGLNGGSFSLFSNNASGYLQFILNGQNAGRVTKVPDAPKNYPSIYREGILDGESATIEYVEFCDDRDDRPRCHGENSVTVYPTSGKDGLKGVPGFRGYPGKRGGNSGIAKIYIKNNSTIQFKVEALPGKFSLGGAGSVGGPGTPGGKADCYRHDMLISLCESSNIHDGAPGVIGDTGSDGNKGENGVRFESIYMNQENSLLNRVF